MEETARTLRLEVITPDASVYCDDVEFVLVRALDGDLGVMHGHAPLIASLDIWPLTVTKEGAEKKIAVAKGFMEVNDNKVTIVTPEAAKHRAEERLASKNEKIDHVRAELALKRAIQRLDVVKTFSGR